MRFIQTTCIVMLSGVTLGVEQVPPETLVAQLLSQETSADVNEACTELRLFLRTAESTTADALRSDLCQQLSLATDHLVIRQIGRVLIAAPSDGVLSAALFRLDDATPEIRRAACDVIAGLGAFQATDPALVDAAVSKLGQVLRDESQPVHLMDSALLALSSLGPQGTNALLKLRSTAAPVKNMTNCFYSALARTGEYRVLPYLRDALSNPSVRQGLQIQAVHGIGQLATKARTNSLPIDSAEAAACVRVLTRVLNSTENDQLYAVTLQALAQLQGVEPNGTLYQTVLSSLYSTSQIRQAAALQTLYAEDCDLIDASLVQILRSVAGFDDPEIAATASAILDKCGANDGNPE